MKRLGRPWLAMLLMAAIVRLATLGAYPLHDTTEARYAEVARLMVTSGDWITPQIELGTPFWAKPPLSIWITATSFQLFGFNEFAARLPAFLLVLLTVALHYHIGRKILSAEGALAACAILLTSGVGYVSAGAVMTDASLLFATTLSLIAFWFAACEQHDAWRYIFFVGLALGLLAKGPVALVLVGLPVFLWSVRYRDLSWLLKSMPWFSGGLVMLGIAVPWYWAAEIRTPGFLEYYLIGEHWLRFIDSGWQGDLYGKAHSQPWGSIWLFGIGGALPWSIIALYAGVIAFRDSSVLRSLSPFHAYLLLWMIAPLLFFTFAANILPSYVLPGLPAFALLLSMWLQNRNGNLHHLGWLMPVLISTAFLNDSFELIAQKSQQELVAFHDSVTTDSSLYYFPNLPYSASFYSKGRARALRSSSDLAQFLSSEDPAYLAMRETRFSRLAESLQPCLVKTSLIHRYVLLEKRGGRCEWTAQAEDKI